MQSPQQYKNNPSTPPNTNGSTGRLTPQPPSTQPSSSSYKRSKVRQAPSPKISPRTLSFNSPQKSPHIKKLGKLFARDKEHTIVAGSQQHKPHEVQEPVAVHSARPRATSAPASARRERLAYEKHIQRTKPDSSNSTRPVRYPGNEPNLQPIPCYPWGDITARPASAPRPARHTSSRKGEATPAGLTLAAGSESIGCDDTFKQLYERAAAYSLLLRCSPPLNSILSNFQTSQPAAQPAMQGAGIASRTSRSASADSWCLSPGTRKLSQAAAIPSFEARQEALIANKKAKTQASQVNDSTASPSRTTRPRITSTAATMKRTVDDLQAWEHRKQEARLNAAYEAALAAAHAEIADATFMPAINERSRRLAAKAAERHWSPDLSRPQQPLEQHDIQQQESLHDQLDALHVSPVAAMHPHIAKVLACRSPAMQQRASASPAQSSPKHSSMRPAAATGAAGITPRTAKQKTYAVMETARKNLSPGNTPKHDRLGPPDESDLQLTSLLPEAAAELLPGPLGTSTTESLTVGCQNAVEVYEPHASIHAWLSSADSTTLPNTQGPSAQTKRHLSFKQTCSPNKAVSTEQAVSPSRITTWADNARAAEESVSAALDAAAEALAHPLPLKPPQSSGTPSVASYCGTEYHVVRVPCSVNDCESSKTGSKSFTKGQTNKCKQDSLKMDMCSDANAASGFVSTLAVAQLSSPGKVSGSATGSQKSPSKSPSRTPCQPPKSVSSPAGRSQITKSDTEAGGTSAKQSSFKLPVGINKGMTTSHARIKTGVSVPMAQLGDDDNSPSAVISPRVMLVPAFQSSRDGWEADATSGNESDGQQLTRRMSRRLKGTIKHHVPVHVITQEEAQLLHGLQAQQQSDFEKGSLSSPKGVASPVCIKTQSPAAQQSGRLANAHSFRSQPCTTTTANGAVSELQTKSINPALRSVSFAAGTTTTSDVNGIPSPADIDNQKPGESSPSKRTLTELLGRIESLKLAVGQGAPTGELLQTWLALQEQVSQALANSRESAQFA